MNPNFIPLTRPFTGFIRCKNALQSSSKVSVWTHSLPYFRSKPCKKYPLGRVHFVKHGMTYLENGRMTHSAVTFWCGNSGFLGGDHPKNRLLPATDIIGPDEICAFCAAKRKT